MISGGAVQGGTGLRVVRVLDQQEYKLLYCTSNLRWTLGLRTRTRKDTVRPP
jgi:hypothetical protein